MSDSPAVVARSDDGAPDSSSTSDYAVFRDALQHFSSEQNALNAALQHSQHALDLHFATFDSQLKRCTQQWTEYTRLQAMQHDLYTGMAKEERRRQKAALLDDDIVMEQAKQQLDQWRQCKPNNQSRSEAASARPFGRERTITAEADIVAQRVCVCPAQLVPSTGAGQGHYAAVEEVGQGQQRDGTEHSSSRGAE